ncbi:MAG TPA: AMP-binding protein [Micromonosporaceae bacterium]|nr:AMP-binding protein [Micromonosporaceae bacterium]
MTTLGNAPPRATAPLWSPDGRTTIVEGLDRAAAAGRRLVFLDGDLTPQVLTMAELARWSAGRARVLIGRFGVVPGERVCVFGPTSPALLATLLGIWRAGAVAVVLPMPRRLDAASLRREVASRVAAAQSRLVLASAGLTGAGPAGAELTAPAAAGLPGVTVVTDDALRGGGTAALPAGPGPDDVALLQFTSGTTATSRAVALRHGQMVANPAQVYHLVGMEPGDTVVSWLPLYHDMGVMTLVGAIAAGLNPCVLATETFINRPAVWLRAVAAYHAAITVAPNFAYGLAASHLALDPSPLDLSSLRCVVNGAEVVDRRTLERFVAAAAPRGLAPEAMCPMYGLAEATLAVSLTLPGEPARFLRVARDALEDGRVVEQAADGGRDLACCGAPLPGTAVVVTDEAGRQLPERTVGEVRVLGPGVVGRYWTPDGSPHPQPMCDAEGRLATGDLGFLSDGELYLCGRKKDMVIVGGRNLYPEDYESLAERVPGVRTGNVMAFALPGSERMVVVAETRLAAAEAEAAGHQILDTLRRELSYAPHEAVLVRAGSLPKTSSGKRCRQRCRSEYQQGQLSIVAVAR